MLEESASKASKKRFQFCFVRETAYRRHFSSKLVRRNKQRGRGIVLESIRVQVLGLADARGFSLGTVAARESCVWQPCPADVTHGRLDEHGTKVSVLTRLQQVRSGPPGSVIECVHTKLYECGQSALIPLI